jgi:hypothetical protein
MNTIEECLIVLSQEKDTLSTLERISEARVTRPGLPVGLMTRLKDSVKTWRRTVRQAFWGPRGLCKFPFFGFIPY